MAYLFNNLIFLAEEVAGEVAKDSDEITLGQAGLNTVLGLGIVFCALAFISLVITLEGKIFKAVGSKKAAPKEPVKIETPAAPVVEEEDLSNDEEIVAVITAAIYAYEAENGTEVPADGLVVRSIRRRIA